MVLYKYMGLGVFTLINYVCPYVPNRHIHTQTYLHMLITHPDGHAHRLERDAGREEEGGELDFGRLTHLMKQVGECA